MNYFQFQDLENVAGILHKINDIRYPVPGYCILITNTCEANTIQRLIDFCCQQNIPHNLFITRSKNPSEIRVFLFPRLNSNFKLDKVFDNQLNVAFCELSGYIPIGDEELYEMINENLILKRFSEELGKVCGEIEEDFGKIVKENLNKR